PPQLIFEGGGLSFRFRHRPVQREKGMTRRICGPAVVALALIAAGFGQAQNPPSKTIVLKAARMFDGKSDALVKPGVVVVQGGKIVAAGPNASAPAGAEVIELGDATLLPGFIDAHTHLTSSYSEDWNQNELDRLRKPIAQLALESSVNARVTLM